MDKRDFKGECVRKKHYLIQKFEFTIRSIKCSSPAGIVNSWGDLEVAWLIRKHDSSERLPIDDCFNGKCIRDRVGNSCLKYLLPLLHWFCCISRANFARKQQNHDFISQVGERGPLNNSRQNSTGQGNLGGPIASLVQFSFGILQYLLFTAKLK